MQLTSLLLLAGAGLASAQSRPMNTSICDYYTTALLKNNTAANQYTLLTLLVLHFMSLLVPWLLFAVFALGLAFAYQRLVQAPLRAQRKAPVERTQEMFKSLFHELLRRTMKEKIIDEGPDLHTRLSLCV